MASLRCLSPDIDTCQRSSRPCRQGICAQRQLRLGDLEKNKLANGRVQDLADVEGLRYTRPS